MSVLMLNLTPKEAALIAELMRSASGGLELWAEPFLSLRAKLQDLARQAQAEAQTAGSPRPDVHLPSEAPGNGTH